MTSLRVPQDFWSRTGRQLRHPQGRVGRLIGHLMASLNWKPYLLAIDALGVRPIDRVLELGFGAGRSLPRLCALAHLGRVEAVDHSSEMVDMARRRNARLLANGRLRLHQGPFSPLPFESEAFERILLVNVLYFFDAEGRDMAECLRVLKPGGRMAIYVTGRATMSKWPFCEPQTHRTFDRTDLARLLEEAGFAPNPVNVREVSLPFGIEGLVATVTKPAFVQPEPPGE